MPSVESHVTSDTGLDPVNTSDLVNRTDCDSNTGPNGSSNTGPNVNSGTDSEPGLVSIALEPRWLGLRVSDQFFLACIAGFLIVLLGLERVQWRWMGTHWVNIEDETWRADAGPPPRFAIDPNLAEWPELALLPRIGETLAKRIVAFRREHGIFATLDEFGDVPGIGPKTIESARKYVLFETSSGSTKNCAPQSRIK